MEKDICEEALYLLSEFEKNPQRLSDCNCNLNIIATLKEEILSFMSGDYKVYSMYPGERYFLDSFVANTQEDRKFQRLFDKIYAKSRKLKK